MNPSRQYLNPDPRREIHHLLQKSMHFGKLIRNKGYTRRRRSDYAEGNK